MTLRNKPYRVIEPETGKLDRSIFVDEAVYQEELEKIFGRAWQMIGHESLVPNTNDFFHTYMGEDSVILTRDSNRKLHAFLNMCRHRGSALVRTDVGNSKNFFCPYHGWTYDLRGQLIGAPYMDSVAGFRMTEHRLPTFASEIWQGFVFVNLTPKCPSAERQSANTRSCFTQRFLIHRFAPTLSCLKLITTPHQYFGKRIPKKI